MKPPDTLDVAWHGSTWRDFPTRPAPRLHGTPVRWGANQHILDVRPQPVYPRRLNNAEKREALDQGLAQLVARLTGHRLTLVEIQQAMAMSTWHLRGWLLALRRRGILRSAPSVTSTPGRPVKVYWVEQP